ncbi:serine/threonine-protein kinase RsbW [Scopulibacillus darangshiensis]|uniref:Serine-protein kinase RsbW n=1 Tax=Scopulibacillus darangshiensis TaxID=442528 RepID=A0A4R2NQU1_9BACL|nr:anti-sigma B factor RsbW [Scopulibacillus darangshiensis]TCP23831.1 serine/threonine-protein kinase RsbW [Scopulibacillus darangshiensis]
MIQSADTIELTIPAKPEYVGIVRLTTSGVANRMGYSYDDIEDIKIAVSEACTNAVKHAYKDVENGQIAIRIECHTDRIEIMVIDKGASFDYQQVVGKLKPLDPNMSLDQVNEGGLGLFLIDTLMDDITISSESGIVVMMTKFLNRDGVDSFADKVSTSTE